MIPVSETEVTRGGYKLSSNWISYPMELYRRLHLELGAVLGVTLHGCDYFMVIQGLPMAGTQEGGSIH